MKKIFYYLFVACICYITSAYASPGETKEFVLPEHHEITQFKNSLSNLINDLKRAEDATLSIDDMYEYYKLSIDRHLSSVGFKYEENALYCAPIPTHNFCETKFRLLLYLRRLELVTIFTESVPSILECVLQIVEDEERNTILMHHFIEQSIVKSQVSKYRIFFSQDFLNHPHASFAAMRERLNHSSSWIEKSPRVRASIIEHIEHMYYANYIHLGLLLNNPYFNSQQPAAFQSKARKLSQKLASESLISVDKHDFLKRSEELLDAQELKKGKVYNELSQKMKTAGCYLVCANYRGGYPALIIVFP